MMMTMMTAAATKTTTSAAATSLTSTSTTISPRSPNRRQQQQKKKKRRWFCCCFRFFLRRRNRRNNRNNRNNHYLLLYYWIIISICIVYLIGIQYTLNQLDSYYQHIITTDNNDNGDSASSAEYKLWMSYHLNNISSLEDLLLSSYQEEDSSQQRIKQKQQGYNDDDDDDGLEGTGGGGGGTGGDGKTTRKKKQEKMEVVVEEEEEEEVGEREDNDTTNINPPTPPRRFTAPEQLKLPKPIINVGFPKAGTSTIFDFFYCNGLKSQHWYCCDDDDDDDNNNQDTNPGGGGNNATEEPELMSRCILDNMAQLNSNSSTTQVKHIFDGCGNYDVYTEINGPRNFKSNNMRTLLDDGSLGDGFPRLLIPQHHYLDKIHDAYPNSTFILNLRPVNDWITSVINWPTQLQIELPREFYLQQQQYPEKFGYVYDNTTTSRNSSSSSSNKNNNNKKKNGNGNGNVGFMMMMRNLLFNDTTIKETLEVLYNFHNDIVRKFVTKYPSHTLIEIDITNNDTGLILAEKFGLNESCWGHSNQNNKHNKKGRRRSKGKKRYQNNKQQLFGFIQGMKRGPGGIMLKPTDRNKGMMMGGNFDKIMEGIIGNNELQQLRSSSNKNLELLSSVDRHQRSEEIRQKSKYLANGKQRQQIFGGNQIAKFRRAANTN